jgi:hypothetical protein
MTTFDEKCIALMTASPKGHARSCFRSAINHLTLASAIADQDPAMAIFRAITAEEEAASGLMLCLKHLGYANAEKLKHHDHAHKSAIIPFLQILGTFFSETFVSSGLKPAFHIKEESGISRLTIAIPMKINGEFLNAYPIPPLNFGVTTDNKNLSYIKQIEAFVAMAGATSILSYIKEQANRRNQILYASPAGYPDVKSVDPKFLEVREARVIVLIRAYLFIYPYPEIQPYVQAALDAFLSMLGKLPINDLHDAV